jgi:hypothetical protein
MNRRRHIPVLVSGATLLVASSALAGGPASNSRGASAEGRRATTVQPASAPKIEAAPKERAAAAGRPAATPKGFGQAAKLLTAVTTKPSTQDLALGVGLPIATKVLSEVLTHLVYAPLLQRGVLEVVTKTNTPKTGAGQASSRTPTSRDPMIAGAAKVLAVPITHAYAWGLRKGVVTAE